MHIILLLARIFYSAGFIMGAHRHFTNELFESAAAHGVPFASFWVMLTGVLSLLGGFSVLIGYKARWGAWLLVAFLILITAMMHRFWEIADENDLDLQQVMFMKNLTILGGALFIAYFGAGPLSVDEE